MTRRIFAIVVAGAALMLTSAAVAADQQPADGPEPMLRAFVRAVYARDLDTYRQLTLPDPRREVLIQGSRINTAKLKQLDDDPTSLQLRQNRPFLYRGREATLTSAGRYPTGTTALYTMAHGGSPNIIRLSRQDDGWKVDVRWWLAMADLETAPPKAGTPEHAARSLTIALLAMDRRAAARFAVGGDKALDLLFQGASREPSGHLDGLAQEMPVIELRPGEFFPIDARVVEGSSDPNTKVLLGLFGSVEIPFVVRRSGSSWLVEPQAFFRYFNR
jgi:hypothetical protein